MGLWGALLVSPLESGQRPHLHSHTLRTSSSNSSQHSSTPGPLSNPLDTWGLHTGGLACSESCISRHGRLEHNSAAGGDAVGSNADLPTLLSGARWFTRKGGSSGKLALPGLQPEDRDTAHRESKHFNHSPPEGIV